MHPQSACNHPPNNTCSHPNVFLMLGQRLRRWPSIENTLVSACAPRQFLMHLYRFSHLGVGVQMAQGDRTTRSPILSLPLAPCCKMNKPHFRTLDYSFINTLDSIAAWHTWGFSVKVGVIGVHFDGFVSEVTVRHAGHLYISNACNFLTLGCSDIWYARYLNNNGMTGSYWFNHVTDPYTLFCSIILYLIRLTNGSSLSDKVRIAHYILFAIGFNIS